MSYLIRYRLQQAQRLLLTSTLSVKEISCKCGFSDSSYFVKVFRKHMKQTPSEYRKTYTMTEERWTLCASSSLICFWIRLSWAFKCQIILWTINDKVARAVSICSGDFSQLCFPIVPVHGFPVNGKPCTCYQNQPSLWGGFKNSILFCGMTLAA